MKNYNLKNVLIFVLTLSLFQSCSIENELIEESFKISPQDNPVVEKLLKMGYQRNSIVETSDFYLAQGDLMFSKNIKDYQGDHD